MPKFHPLEVKDIRKETDECVSVEFKVPDNLKQEYQFIQGQYLTLKTDINGEEVRRSYSVCVSPLEEQLRVAIKKVYKGRFSTFANEQLQVGDVLDVMTPMGRFYSEVKSEQSKNYVGFAGGSGITPVISILKTVLETEPESTFTLFYANKGVDSIIFRDTIDALKNMHMGRLIVHHIFSEEHMESPLFNGFITAEKCEAFAKANLLDVEHTDEYFICGPEPMMLAIKAGLEGLGIDQKKIHIELFSSPLDAKKKQASAEKFVPTSNEQDSEVSIIIDGIAVDFPLKTGTHTILDGALKNGADLPYACKGGVCCTCKAMLKEGEVEMEVNWGLEPEEVEAGYILTCQAHPKTKKVVVDFDV